MTSAATRKTCRMAKRSDGDDRVDVAALRRQQQRAAHRAEALHRHGDRDDGLAARSDAHDARARACRAPRDLGQASAVRSGRSPRRPAGRFAEQSLRMPFQVRSTKVSSFLRERRQVEAQDVAARIEPARIEEQRALAVVDARARARRRDEAAQQRRDALRVDGRIRAATAPPRRAPRLSPACSSSSLSGSMVIASVSTVADAAIGAAMISPCVSRLWTRASIRPARNWLR